MSKKSCILIAVVVIILFLILAACGTLCVLLVNAIAKYNPNTAVSTFREETIVSGGSDKILVIPVEGEILDTENSASIFSTGIVSSSRIVSYIEEAENSTDVKAIILDINSPGGAVYAADSIHNKIVEAENQGIIVIALMRDTAASGGYYIAAPADGIVASPLTITGSIGVRLDVQSLSGLYEKLGIETRTITNSQGKYKTGEGLFDNNPNGEEDQIYQQIVNEAYDRFIEVVTTGRNLSEEEVLAIADGRVITGKQALDLKLIDALGAMDEAIVMAETKAGISDATIVKYGSNDFWSMLMGYVSNVVNPTARVLEGLEITPGPRLMYLYEE